VSELFTGAGFRAVEMDAGDVPRLAAFYAANPEYHLIVAGGPAPPAEAREDFEMSLPEGWPCSRKWPVLFEGADGVAGVATMVQDLFAPGIWNIGLFIAATSLHGSGRPRAMYVALESWMKGKGARWSRLGVVDGNARGRAFWARMGYTPVSVRENFRIGRLSHRLHVLVKPLGDADWDWYRRAVPRYAGGAPGEV